jgi:ankyrin repeat protein
MRLLAQHGANPLLPTAQGVTPLMAAAGLGYWEGETPGPITGTPESERLEAVKLAIELGGDVRAVADFNNVPIEGDGETLLHEYVKNLEEQPEAAVGDVRWAGSTALHGAAVANQAQIVRLLVERGAALDARNRLGWTPLMVTQGMFVAAHGGLKRGEAEAMLRQLMIERGMDPAAYGQRSPAVSTSQDR